MSYRILNLHDRLGAVAPTSIRSERAAVTMYELRCIQISVSWSTMKTTLDLRDDLLSKAKQQAAKEHISLTRMIEEGLTLRLRRSRNPRRQLKPRPVSRRKGGLRQGIDGRSNKSLFDAAD